MSWTARRTPIDQDRGDVIRQSSIGCWEERTQKPQDRRRTPTVITTTSDHSGSHQVPVPSETQTFYSQLSRIPIGRVRSVATCGLAIGLLLGLIVWLQGELAHRLGSVVQTREQLRLLPHGEVLKPALLGFHHLGADVLWLHLVQVLGQRDVPPSDYEWAYHALDVITTLDPHYAYAYDAGGVVLAELAERVNWSNELLKKGLAANPEAWRLAFQLGFNHFFHLHDYQAAADYMAIAARLPGRPAYVPELAARLYVEAKNPDLALQFLASVRAANHDPQILAALDRRHDEVLIERDLAMLEQALARYWDRHHRYPAALDELVDAQLLAQLPVEPFGGRYLLDSTTGQVSSSTHSRRLRLYRPSEISPMLTSVSP